VTDDDGPLDADDGVDVADWASDLTYREVHLFTEGAYRGLLRLDPRPGKKLQGRVLADSWYYKGGYVLGYLSKAVILGEAVGADVVGRAARLLPRLLSIVPA
jgi:hypothetical protein